MTTPLPEPATREADLETFFHRHVRAVGGMSIKLAPTRAGIPDRLILLPGGGLHLVELKTTTGAVRPIQAVFHERAAALGVHVAVLRGRGEILAWLRDRLDATLPPERDKDTRNRRHAG